MDVLRRLSRGGDTIALSADDRVVEAQRVGLAAVARWASGCLAHDELEAAAYQRRVLAAFEGGESAEHVVADVATQVELAGKPSLASFASIVFAEALDQTAASSVPKVRRDTELYGLR